MRPSSNPFRHHPVVTARRVALAITALLFLVVLAITVGTIRSNVAPGATPEATEVTTAPATPGTGSAPRPGASPATPDPAPIPDAKPDAATIAAWWAQAEATGECAGALSPVPGAAALGVHFVGGCPDAVKVSYRNVRSEDGVTGAQAFWGRNVTACAEPYVSGVTRVIVPGTEMMIVEGPATLWLVDRDSVVRTFTGTEYDPATWPFTTSCRG